MYKKKDTTDARTVRGLWQIRESFYAFREGGYIMRVVIFVLLRNVDIDCKIDDLCVCVCVCVCVLSW